MAKVIIIGPAHPLRGGLATFNQRLAKEFIDAGHNCSIYSFSLQYPSFLFPGTTQYSSEPAPANLTIHTAINSVNPLNWITVGNKIKKEKPDLVIVRYWLPFMGPALGTILRRIKQNNHSKIVCIADNVIPHEKRPGDIPFTRYFLKGCDAFITMSEKVMNDLRLFEKSKPAQLVQHPLYDTFGEIIPQADARAHLDIAADEKILLFFGFIRKYKGLDILLDAIEILKQRNYQPAGQKLRFLVAGEFYEDAKPYKDKIETAGLASQLILRTDFIPDSEVRYYLCAADGVIQPYRNATQSGVTPLAYHFEKPMIVTNVGGLPSLVPHKKAGLVVEPDAQSIANGIEDFFKMGEDYFLPHLRIEKQKYSWQVLMNTIMELSNSTL